MRNPARDELLKLCSRLRGEKLLVSSEIELLQQLNQNVEQRLTELQKTSWISAQQQFSLSSLLNAHPEATPQNCCRRARALSEYTEFEEAYRKLGGGVNEASVGDLIRLLLQNSRFTAGFLYRVDCIDPPQSYKLTHCIFTSVYGSAVFPCDERKVLEVLYYLMQLQILPKASQARRLLRRGTCAFSRLFKWLITDGGGIYSAKLFLLSALHQPIMELISSEELYLDIDPSKAAYRFPPAERARRFGEEGTALYKETLIKHRKEIVTKLVSLAQKFIESLKTCFCHCFPPPLAWLLRQLHDMLTADDRMSTSEVSLIITDLVFTCFLCPAIANPESLGIVLETPITHVARFNLMQIGQILQTLAVSPWERLDPKLNDIYALLDAESVTSFVTGILALGNRNAPTIERGDRTSDLFGGLDEIYESTDSSRVTESLGVDLSRTYALISIPELNSLVLLLRKVQVDPSIDEPMTEMWQTVRNILSQLPETFVDNQSQPPQQSEVGAGSTPSSTKKKSTLKLGKPKVPSVLAKSPSGERLQAFFGRSEWSASNDHSGHAEPDVLGGQKDDPSVVGPEQVLLIPLSPPKDPVGLMPEEKFFATTKQLDTVSNGKSATAGSSGTSEKRTRFSLQAPPDLESIGTSDQMDDVDDGESVSSSVDAGGNADMGAMILNDNFSDVDVVPISANVSGRGSPSLSGRDTPMSSHTEQQGDAEEPGTQNGYERSAKQETGDSSRNSTTTGGHRTEKRSLLMPDLPVTAQKENQADIEEKFGKFEIPPPQRERHRDETHSLVSDSWSTDVLASDSEFGGEYLMAVQPGFFPVGGLPDLVPGQIPEFPRLDLIAEEGASASCGGFGGEASAGGGRLGSVCGETESLIASCDRSDTWSVDAMASDSEVDLSQKNDDRLKDLEIDERQNVREFLMENPVNIVDPKDTSDRDSVDRISSIGEAANANAVERCQPVPPEITFSMERDFHHVERNVMRRQSSGSSFWSRQSDGDDNQANRRGSNTEPLSDDRSIEPRKQLNDNLPKQQSQRAKHQQQENSKEKNFSEQSQRSNWERFDASETNAGALQSVKNSMDNNSNGNNGGGTSNNTVNASNNGPDNPTAAGHFSSASSDASSVDASSAGATLGSPTSEDRRLAALRATGAIPKKFPGRLIGSGTSSTVTPPSSDLDGRRGFFKGFKLTNLKNKVRRSQGSGNDGFTLSLRSLSPETRQNHSGMGVTYSTSVDSFNNSLDSSSTGCGPPQDETSEDILAKYRQQSVTRPTNDSFSPPEGVLANNNNMLIDLMPETGSSDGRSNVATVFSSEGAQKVEVDREMTPGRAYFDPHNVTQCQAFLDAKRKLRQVLSLADVSALPTGLETTTQQRNTKDSSTQASELVNFLRLLLADALADGVQAQQKFLAAQLRETLRCLSLFDQRSVRKLLRVLHEEHRRRTAYTTYLQLSRLRLLQTKAYLEKLIGRITREQSLSGECLVDLCARIFMEQRYERQLRNFVQEFHRLEAHDEKTDLVERFLSQVYAAMQRDVIWQDASNDQLRFARLSIERSVMAQIYLAAMSPNGEGDTMRDQIFYDAIKRLSTVVTPDHRDLKIPSEYHAECPWPAAQAEIAVINAYKTPRDKVGCVVRCCETIVGLLRLAVPDGRPSADDLIPVLVFVIIKANPCGLLSTVQYVNGFYGTRLEGEEAYWWTQFCSAVEFIKIMADYHQQRPPCSPNKYIYASFNSDDGAFGLMADDNGDEPCIPRAALNKLIKDVVPHVRVANESRDLLHACCVEFIKTVGAEANRICALEQKKTITQEHVLRALATLGFGPDYIGAAQSVLDKCKEAAQKRLQRQNSRLDKCGIPEDELLKQQQELFEKARAVQAEAEQSQLALFQQLLAAQQQQNLLKRPDVVDSQCSAIQTSGSPSSSENVQNEESVSAVKSSRPSQMAELDEDYDAMD